MYTANFRLVLFGDVWVNVEIVVYLWLNEASFDLTVCYAF